MSNDLGLSRALASSRAIEFSLLRASSARDPHLVFRQMRSAYGPLYKSELGYWFVLGHHECKTLLSDPRSAALTELTSRPDVTAGEYPLLEMLQRSWLLFSNGDTHRSMRERLMVSLGPRMKEALDARVDRLVDSTISEVDWASPVEFVDAVAKPVPIGVLGEILQIPAHDRPYVGRLTVDMSEVLEPFLSRARLQRAEAAALKLQAYFRKADAHRTDPVPLSSTEDHWVAQDVPNAILLAASGHETTTNMLSASMHALVSDPASIVAFLDPRVDPSKAVEELLRFTTPIQLIARIAIEPIQLDGQVIRSGDVMMFILAAANRDPAVFPSPDNLEFHRSSNPHLTFGASSHVCFGQALARVEIKSVFNALKPVLGRHSYTVDAAVWSSKRTVRGMTKLAILPRPAL